MSLPLKPSEIVRQLDQHVIGQVDAKRTLAVAIYTHFRKMAWSESSTVDVTKSNILLIGPTGQKSGRNKRGARMNDRMNKESRITAAARGYAGDFPSWREALQAQPI